MFCRNCGNKLEEDTKFCPKCGTEVKKEENTIVEETVVETKIENEKETTEIPTTNSINEQPTQINQNNKKSNNSIIIIIIVVLLVVISGLVCTLLFTGNSNKVEDKKDNKIVEPSKDKKDDENKTKKDDENNTKKDSTVTTDDNTYTFKGYTFTLPKGFKVKEEDADKNMLELLSDSVYIGLVFENGTMDSYYNNPQLYLDVYANSNVTNPKTYIKSGKKMVTLEAIDDDQKGLYTISEFDKSVSVEALIINKYNYYDYSSLTTLGEFLSSATTKSTFSSKDGFEKAKSIGTAIKDINKYEFTK